MQQSPQYKFYATMLDSFRWYLTSESESAHQEFIDKINRVPETDPAAIERMNRGTKLNELIDLILDGRIDLGDDPVTIHDGYEFKTKHVVDIVCRLHGATSQVYTSSTIDVNGVEVLIYGYIDYIREDKAIDLKTTKEYELGKYKGSMQRHAYPVCLHANGSTVKSFDFIVMDKDGVYSESYPTSFDQSYSELVDVCARLIQFIEANRDSITDLKIFAQA